MSTDKRHNYSLIKSAGLVSGFTALSRVLGLIREQVMAYFFGAGMATDAFITAFRVPNLLRDMFAEGALSSAFVPVFKEKLVKENDEDAFSLGNVVFTAILLVVGIIVLLGIIAAPLLIYITANGFTEIPAKFDLTVSLTRLMFVYLLLVSLSALVMGMLNSFGKFGLPAIAPAVFNIGIISCTVLLYNFFDLPVYAMAIGVLLGGFGQVVVQLPQLFKLGFKFRPRLDFFDEGFKKVIRLFVPMVVGLSASRINIIVNTLLASFLIEGAISYLNYSYRLMHFPLGVFAVALGTVALPRASELASQGDLEGLKKTFLQALNMNMLLIIPSALILAYWGGSIVSLIYQHGEFSELDTQRTALALIHYSYGLIGFAAVRVTVPVYYALGDSRLPMKISLLSILLNIVLYFPLMKILSFAGLAAATSIAGLLNFALLLLYLPRKGIHIDYPKMFLNIFKICMAAVLSILASRFVPVNFAAEPGGIMGRILDLFIPILAGLVVFIILCVIFRIKELTLIKERLLSRKRNPKDDS